MRARLPCFVLAVLLLGSAAPPARAGALGEEWEELILDGMRRQDVRTREVTLDRVVGEALATADRPSTGAARVARLYLLGRAYGKRLDPKHRDLENAREVYREALKLAPKCYFAWRDLGVLAFQARPKPDLREAEASFQKALSFNSSYVQALRDLAKLCLEGNRPADAAVHLRRVIDLEPTDALARGYLALALLQLKRPEEALREVDRLLKSQPQSPTFRDLRARVELSAGRPHDAIARWKVLVLELPSWPAPLWGLWEAYSGLVKAGTQVPKADLLEVVGRLIVVETDESKRIELREVYKALDAPPPDPNKPPDDATLIRVLAAPEEAQRINALKYIAYRAERPSPEVLRAVLAHLGPGREPVPAVREAALGVYARHGGLGTVPIVRLLLRDPAPGVRLAALLALVSVGTQSPEAARAALLAIARFADDPEPRVAADARAAVLGLANGTLEPLPEGATETEAARRVRWQAWWASPVGVDARIRALAVYDQVRDHHADDVLIPYVDDPDFYVLQATYDALVKSAAHLTDPVRRAWAAGIPRIQPGEFVPENRVTILKSLKDWLATRPAAR